MLSLAFLTQHRKQQAVAIALANAGYLVYEVDDFDTDTFGTFTGEIARLDSQSDTALKKAQMACELSGNRFGLGSEGSFGADPMLGMLPWGTEVLAFWDAELNYAIYGWVQGAQTNYNHTTVTTMQQAQQFANRIGFPLHGIIVGQANQPIFNKDLNSDAALAAYLTPLLLSGDPIDLNTDMRANRNPTRRLMLARCAEALAQKLNCACPQCHAAGFAITKHIAGALCEYCHLPTTMPKASVWHCPLCQFEQIQTIDTRATQGQCQYCNP